MEVILDERIPDDRVYSVNGRLVVGRTVFKMIEAGFGLQAIKSGGIPVFRPAGEPTGPPMRDNPELIAAIAANPDDDTVRLAYADWLAETEQYDREEFVRGHIALESMGTPEEKTLGEWPGTDVKVTTKSRCVACGALPTVMELCPFHQLYFRLMELFGKHGWQWLGEMQWGSFELRQHGVRSFTSNPGVPRGEYVRGFVEGLTCDGEWWVEHADELREKHPLRAVSLTTRPEMIQDKVHGSRYGDLYHLTHDLPGHHPHLYMTASLLKEQKPAELGDLLPPLLRLRWPGIQFDVPEPSGPTRASFEVVAIPRTLRGVRDLTSYVGTINSKEFMKWGERSLFLVEASTSRIPNTESPLIDVEVRFTFRPTGDQPAFPRGFTHADVYLSADFNELLRDMDVVSVG